MISSWVQADEIDAAPRYKTLLKIVYSSQEGFSLVGVVISLCHPVIEEALFWIVESLVSVAGGAVSVVTALDFIDTENASSLCLVSEAILEMMTLGDGDEHKGWFSSTEKKNST